MVAPILVAKNQKTELLLLPALANRHGLIAGATGTGKTGPRGGRQSQGLLEAMAKSAARTVGSQVGREIIRGVLGSILGKRR